jgi:hypothetical protein
VRNAQVRVTDGDTYDRLTTVALTGPFTLERSRGGHSEETDDHPRGASEDEHGPQKETHR